MAQKESRVSLGRKVINRGTSALDSDRLLGVLAILPVVVILVTVTVTPALYGFWASLHEIHALNPVWHWSGLGNYVHVFQQSDFHTALANGVVYTVGSVVVQLVIGIWVALLLNKTNSRLVTSASLALYVIPTVVVLFIFEWMLDERSGLLMNWATETGLLERSISVWASSDLAMAAVILIGSYKYSIFITLMVLARLQSIPSSHYEAAITSGATTIQQFVYITWPQIRGVVALVVLLRGIFMFNKFDIVWILTQGGPGTSTMILPVYAFKTMFQDYAYGQASTIAMIMFGILTVGGIIYFTVFRPAQDVSGGSQ